MKPFDKNTGKTKRILSLLDELHNNPHRSWDEIIAQIKKEDETSVEKVARNLLEDTDSRKRRLGAEVLMAINPEKYVDVILPLLNDVDLEVRWLVVHRITRTEKFTNNSEMVNLVIKSLLEDPSPEVRVEAAEALGYCRTPDAKSALIWARDHDFEIDDQGLTVSHVASMALNNFVDL